MLARSMSPSIWSNLPEDILYAAVDFLGKDQRSLPPERQLELEGYYGNPGCSSRRSLRRDLCLIASICKLWALRYRPALFSNLELRSLADLAFLEQLLKSPVAGWLSASVCCISCAVPGRTSLRLWRFHWCLMIRQLSSLSRLSWVGPSTSPFCIYPPSPRPIPSPCGNISVLRLENWHFRTFSTLIRQLGALPLLSNLELRNVTWEGELDPSDLPRCSGGFEYLQEIKTVGKCTLYWPLSWIISSPALHHQYSWTAGSAITVSPRRDIAVIAEVLELLSCGLTLDNFGATRRETGNEGMNNPYILMFTLP